MTKKLNYYYLMTLFSKYFNTFSEICSPIKVQSVFYTPFNLIKPISSRPL